MDIDTSKWSGEGSFTQRLIDHLAKLDGITFIRVEDAPASRSEADYNFISNEVFVAFATAVRTEPIKRLGLFPGSRTVQYQKLDVTWIEPAWRRSQIGAPDYSDDGMLQYLRTERIVPPYQTRGYKLVELVRVYDASAPRRS